MRDLKPIAALLATALFVMFLTDSASSAARTREGAEMQTAGARIHAPEFPQYADWINTDRDWKMQDFRGKFVLLDFWTFCCINCMHVLPDLHRLEQKYPQLVVVGVHSAKFQSERSTANIREAILRYGIEHPVINDYRFELWKAYGIQAWPSFVLVDPEGYVAGQSSGEGVYEVFDRNIARLSVEFEKKGLLDTKRIEFKLDKFREPKSLLAFPGKLEADSAKGGRLFVTDSDHNRVLALDPEGGVLDVIGSGSPGRADGGFGEAELLRPQGLAYDSKSDILYVADTENHLIRRVDLKARRVSTILGTGVQAGRSGGGVGTACAINSPWDVLLYGERLIIAMAGPHQLWSLDLSDLQAAPWAGSGWENIQDGPALEAALAQPSGLSTDGRAVYFADSETSSIRKMEGGRVSTLVGAGLFDFGDIDGPLGKARFQHALGVLWHDGLLYVADTYNNKIRTIDTRRGQVGTLIGTGESGREDGPRLSARLNEPNDIAFLKGRFYITDTNNGLIRTYDPATERVGTLELKNLDRLNPAGFAPLEHQVTLEERTVGPGAAVLELRVPLGPGLKINTEAPNLVKVTTSDSSAVRVGKYTLGTGGSPFARVPLETTAGQAVLSVELEVYYCDEETGGRCFLDQARYALPLRVEAGGTAKLELVHQVPQAGG